MRPVHFLLSILALTGAFFHKEKCFEGLGCFSQEYPWFSVTRPFPPPASPDYLNVRLYLYTRENRKINFTVTPWPNGTVEGSNYQPGRRTVFATHGFAASGRSSWLLTLKDYYLDNMEANVFVVDWGKGAMTGINYLQAAANTRVVAAVLTKFLMYLVGEGQTLSDVHLLGHSLGAHICGYVAKDATDQTGVIVAKITGFDPAQPGFEPQPAIVRLSKDDAAYVEVVHSDAIPFIPYIGLGYLHSLGDVDFYLNKGIQPGCLSYEGKISSINDLLTIPVEVLSMGLGCSHGRSFEVYTAAINPRANCTYMGYRAKPYPSLKAPFSCKKKTTCLPMGLHTEDAGLTGVFKVRTSSEEPYCCDRYTFFLRCLN